MSSGRPPLDLPPTTPETRALLGQLRAHREDVVAKKRRREDERDRDRKIRIGARLVRFVRRGDSAAKQLLNKIFAGLRDGDRPLFVGWDVYPTPPPPVPISDRQLPRTLQEIDDEIRRLEAHLEKRLEEDSEDDKRQHARRMTIVGGALLGLVEAGDAEADAMLKTILPKIPRKEMAPFEGWDPPTLPAPAAQAAQNVSASQAPPSEPGAHKPGRKPVAAGKTSASDAPPARQAGPPDAGNGRGGLQAGQSVSTAQDRQERESAATVPNAADRQQRSQAGRLHGKDS